MSSDLRRLLDQSARKILENAKEDYGKDVMRKAISRAFDDSRDQVTQADVQHVLSNRPENFAGTMSKWLVLILTCIFSIFLIIVLVFFINSSYSIIDMTNATIRANYYLAVITSGIVLGIGSYKWVLKDYLNARRLSK